ncbi:MAG: hypothetical protein GY773_28105 [Actinomycetia bacterium]|nr:hypothetical protein [Actinomycetes bacterium]
MLRDIERLGYDSIFLTTITELAGGIDASRPERTILDSAIDQCRDLFDEIKGVDLAHQTLLTQRLLPQLADTFAYWALVSEGIDQASSAGDSKLTAAELFNRLHLNPIEGGFGEDHLSLITHLVGGD